MNLQDLRPAKGAKVKKTRVGRGQASGLGKTSGRGHGGQKSRTGGGVRLGFEGGQLPIYRRLPKRGFSNARFKTEYAILNIGDLAELGLEEITPEVLVEQGIIKKLYDGLKILGDGEIDQALTVKAHKFTKSAVEKIEKAGGKAEVI